MAETLKQSSVMGLGLRPGRRSLRTVVFPIYV